MPQPRHLGDKLQLLSLYDPEYLAWLEALIDGHLGDLRAEASREVDRAPAAPTPGWSGRRRRS